MEAFRTAGFARLGSDGPHTLVIHAEGDWARSIEAGAHVFFTKLMRQATARGLTTRVVSAGGATSQLLLGQEHVHVMVGGAPGYGPNRLHAAPGHLWGFWYLDEVGSGAHSSIRFARFSADEVDGEKAEYFFNGVTGYMLRENVSKRPQPARDASLPDPAAAVVFCQLIERTGDRLHHLTTEQMVRVAATTAGSRRVYVKPHPDTPRALRRGLEDMAAGYRNVVVSDASVHDLAGASDVVVTQNSSAGFEALMQKKCVVTCGKSDFWHATLTPKTEDDLRDALLQGRETMATFPFEKYLYWHLDRMCLEPEKPDFAARAWARIRDKAML